MMHQNGSPKSWRKKNTTERRKKLGIGRSARSVMKRRRSIWKEDLGREVDEDKELRTTRTLEKITRSVEDCVTHDLV